MGNGHLPGLPADDTVAGVPVYLRIGLRNTIVSLPLSTEYTLTIGLRTGGTPIVSSTVAACTTTCSSKPQARWAVC